MQVPALTALSMQAWSCMLPLPIANFACASASASAFALVNMADAAGGVFKLEMW